MICGVTSDLEAIKCAALNLFMRQATLFRTYPHSGLKMAEKPA